MRKALLLMGVAGFMILCAAGCKKSDLVVEIAASTSVAETHKIPILFVTVSNRGNAWASGTGMGVLGGTNANGYKVDVVLSKDMVATSRYETPNPYEFEEDILLMGGRISHTKTLGPNEAVTYTLTNVVPVPPGVVLGTDSVANVYIGALADSRNNITESREDNNTAFLPIEVTRP